MEHRVLATLISATLAGTFTFYPGSNNPNLEIEAITDRGPILEMIVRCPKGTAIITYSKLERLYCGPRLTCASDRRAVIRQACE